MNGSPWPERDDELRRLWFMEPQISTKEIGARMRLTKCAVIGRARRLNLPSRGNPVCGENAVMTAAVIAQVKKMRAAGSNLEAISRHLGINRKTISSGLFRLGRPKQQQAAPKRRGAAALREAKAATVAAQPQQKPAASAPPKPAIRGVHSAAVHECQYPIGSRPYRFCGERAVRGSYCAAHHRLCYVRAATVEDRSAA